MEPNTTLNQMEICTLFKFDNTGSLSVDETQSIPDLKARCLWRSAVGLHAYYGERILVCDGPNGIREFCRWTPISDWIHLGVTAGSKVSFSCI